MKILVDKIPESPRYCLFSELKNAGNKSCYICNLRGYTLKADINFNGYKPRCVCRDTSNCEFLQEVE